jgi:glucan biosynthesis protein C
MENRDAAMITSTGQLPDKLAETKRRASLNERLHFLDAARATMLLLGIPFHASEVYRVSGGFSIASPDTSQLASLVSALVHGFRMPAFFMLSGYFAALLLARRTPDTWLKGRMKRLAIPLVVTALALGPLEAAIKLMVADHLSWAESLSQAYALPPRKWINHRWFLVVVLIFSTATAALQPRISDEALGGLGARLKRPGRWILLVITLLTPLAAIVIGKLAGEVLTHSPFVRQYAWLSSKYALYFTLGYLALRTKRPALIMGSLSRPELTLAITSMGLYLATYFAFYTPESYGALNRISKVVPAAIIANEGLAGYFSARIFFWFVRHIFDRQSPLVAYFVNASFVIYLMHIVFIYALAAYFLRVSWPPIIEIVVTSAVCLGACVACFECVRRSRVAGVLLNGEAFEPRPRLLAQTG